ncbi:hypothetical protein A6E15_19180 [Natrinema saccharevitans]|uniref:Uncharacterized protein n=1 Tax=Natrinema saccharevitans TaxID=301967 RepID=A0A1S8AQI2_9EURY|nr:hypothetical protein [Natrinema saccharevitans]OLZ39088.1 hypothetical protein A6E15_19180 [Natrinema saccharevitans]
MTDYPTQAATVVSELNEGDIIRVPQYKNALEVAYVNEDNDYIGVEFSDDAKKTSAMKNLIVNVNSGRVYLAAGSTRKGEVDEIEVVAAVETDEDDNADEDEPDADDEDDETEFLAALTEADGVECAGDGGNEGELLAWIEPVVPEGKEEVISRLERLAAEYGFENAGTEFASGSYGVFFDPIEDDEDTDSEEADAAIAADGGVAAGQPADGIEIGQQLDERTHYAHVRYAARDAPGVIWYDPRDGREYLTFDVEADPDDLEVGESVVTSVKIMPYQPAEYGEPAAKYVVKRQRAQKELVEPTGEGEPFPTVRTYGGSEVFDSLEAARTHLRETFDEYAAAPRRDAVRTRLGEE